MRYVSEHKFFYLYPVNNLSEASKELYVKGDKVTLRIITAFPGKRKIPVNLPPEISFRETSDGWIDITMDRQLPVSDVTQQDFDAEAKAFHKKVKKLFSIAGCIDDTVEWGLIANENQDEQFLNFCKSDYSTAILEYYDHWRQQQIADGLKLYYLTKVPVDENKVLLMMRQLSAISHASICEFRIDSEERIMRNTEECIGCYLKASEQVCLFREQDMALDFYIECGEEGRMVWLDTEDLYWRIHRKILNSLGPLPEKDPNAYNKSERLFHCVAGRCEITLDDVDAIVTDPEKWVCQKANDVKNNKSDVRLQKLIQSIILGSNE